MIGKVHGDRGLEVTWESRIREVVMAGVVNRCSGRLVFRAIEQFVVSCTSLIVAMGCEDMAIAGLMRRKLTCCQRGKV
jgi:hypothetical protein